jgi:hypothetical protein
MGSGRTTKQMREAPHGAVFVWCNGQLFYPRDLARHLGRADLEIVSPDSMREYHRFMGRKLSGLVIDHAAELNARQYDGMRHVNDRIVHNNP